MSHWHEQEQRILAVIGDVDVDADAEEALSAVVPASDFPTEVAMRGYWDGLKNDKAFRLYQRLGFRRVAQSETHNHMEYEPVV
jgi:hypothetical protein